MPYAAVRYYVKPGHEDEIAKLFANFKRADTPVFRDAEGNEVGRLLGTAVFLKDEVLVRVIHYEGSIAEVGKHMAKQKGVHLLEEKLQPYLAERRDTASPEKFAAFFATSLMSNISELTALPEVVGER